METQTLKRRICQTLIDSPTAFNRYVLGRPDYWSKQIEICRALRSGKSTILVPSGNATGKSWLMAGILHWYLAAKPQGVIVTTAPTADQLENVLWRAVFNAYEKRNVDFLGATPRITRQPLLIEKHKDSYAIGLSTTKQEATTGHHATDLLVLVDEASGVDDDRISALNSLNPSQVIMIGNPLVPSGIFYERVTRQELDPDPKTALIRIRSDETPPVLAGQWRSDTGLSDLSFLDRSRRDYGEGSPWWLSHITAHFPDTSEGALFETTWIDACYGKPPERDNVKIEQLVLGVDIATGRGGDSSVWILRDNHGIIDGESSNNTPIEQWADKVANVAKSRYLKGNQIIYDATGVGETFGILLRDRGVPDTIGFQGGRGSHVRYENLRSATYWALRKRLNVGLIQDRFHIPEPFFFKLRKELLAHRYELTSKDKIAIISKDQIAAKIGHSPDWADCLSMTFAFANTG